MRYKNTSDVSEYIKNSSVPYALRTDVQVLDKRDLESEYMILGLRMTKGVSENTFSQRFKEDVDDVFGEVIRKYVKAGFLIREGGQIRLAGKAMFVSNAILAEFIDP